MGGVGLRLGAAFVSHPRRSALPGRQTRQDTESEIDSVGAVAKKDDAQVGCALGRDVRVNTRRKRFWRQNAIFIFRVGRSHAGKQKIRSTGETGF